MSKQGRDPILRGEMQSDMDGGAFNIVNVNAVGNVQQATLHVDPSLPEEIGERATGLPFRTLAAAVAAAEPGDVILLRPGIHAYDGSVDIADLDGLRIIGYGAIIKSSSAVNEDIKINVQSEYVIIEGIEFDGEVTVDRTDSLAGVIAVSANECFIRRCYIHDQNACAIRFNVGYSRIHILDNLIDNCCEGVRAICNDTTTDRKGVEIRGNLFQRNRQYGVAIVGPGVDSGHVLTEIEITDNNFNNNNTIASTYPGLYIAAACHEIRIDGNEFYYEEVAISLNQCQSIQIGDNFIRGAVSYAILIQGCFILVVSDNFVDGRNSAGSIATGIAFGASGSYSGVPNDAGEFTITGNHFTNLLNVSISISNAGLITVSGNYLDSTAVFAAIVALLVEGNFFHVSQTTQGILLNALDRGMAHLSIKSNHFRFVGATINRCICTVDASGFGIGDLSIVGNSTEVGRVFAIGTYTHSGSNPPTNVFILGNTPEAATSISTGWANEDQNLGIGKVFVSQSRGDDADGQIHDRTRKFRTINAAITAASRVTR